MAYREWNPGTDDAWLECWWTATREGGGSHRVVPDGCVDILVDPVAGRARVVGAMTRPVVLEGGPASWVAARFRPGRAVGLFPGVSELTDAAVDLEALWPEAGRWIEAVARAPDAGAAVRALQGGLALRRTPLPERRLLHAIDALWAGESVAGVAARVGWTRQNLTRRVGAAVGYRASLLRRVGRLTRLLAGDAAEPWTDRAYRHGYADGAHLSRDFHALVGIAPSAWGSIRSSGPADARLPRTQEAP